MLDLVNTQRQQNGASPLVIDADCMTAATAHTNDQASHLFMGHIGSDGSTVGDRLTATGFKWNFVAENVAEGQKTVEDVMTAWMNSPGHRENILNPDYTRFGYDEATGSDGNNYWTQVFGNPMPRFTPQTVTPSITTPPPTTQVAPAAPVPFVAPSKVSDPTTGFTLTKMLENTISNISNSSNRTSPSKESQTAPSSPIASPSGTSSPSPASTQETDSNFPIMSPKKLSGDPIHIEDISNHIPRIILESVPANVQKYVNNPLQYCINIISSLKSSIPAAIAAAKYYPGHPGLTDPEKYAKTTYANFMIQESSSATKLKVAVISIIVSNLL